MGKPVDDSDAMIEMCLECPFPECINCLGSSTAYGWAVRFYFKYKDEFDRIEFEKLREKVKPRQLKHG